jgi:hypothetical protein
MATRSIALPGSRARCLRGTLVFTNWSSYLEATAGQKLKSTLMFLHRAVTL